MKLIAGACTILMLSSAVALAGGDRTGDRRCGWLMDTNRTWLWDTKRDRNWTWDTKRDRMWTWDTRRDRNWLGMRTAERTK